MVSITSRLIKDITRIRYKYLCVFREKGNERKFVFVIASFRSYIDLNKIDIDIDFVQQYLPLPSYVTPWEPVALCPLLLAPIYYFTHFYS